MWIFFLLIILFIIVLVWLVYYQPQHLTTYKCSISSYLPYPSLEGRNLERSDEWDKFLFALNANTFLSNCPNLGPIPVPDGFTVQKITGIYDDMYGYAFSNKNTVIISFTGTFYYYQWKLDMKSQLVPAQILIPGIKVHQGFLEVYSSIRAQVKNLNLEGKNIYITGISLGGALASISGLDLAMYDPKVYTFASPKVFDIQGAELVNKLVPNITRIYNTEDPVIKFPYSRNYMHVGQPQTFSLNLGSGIKNHTKAYQQYFKA